MNQELADWMSFLRAERGASKHTLRAYQGDLLGLVQYLGDRDRELRSASLHDLRAWLAIMARRGQDGEPAAPASMARRISSVRAFYQWMVRQGRLEESPAERLGRPKVPRRSPRFLDVDEANEVVEAPTQSGRLLIRKGYPCDLI